MAGWLSLDRLPDRTRGSKPVDCASTWQALCFSKPEIRWNSFQEIPGKPYQRHRKLTPTEVAVPVRSLQDSPIAVRGTPSMTGKGNCSMSPRRISVSGGATAMGESTWMKISSRQQGSYWRRQTKQGGAPATSISGPTMDGSTWRKTTEVSPALSARRKTYLNFSKYAYLFA